MHAVASDTPATCENCGTVLQGAYCHACGQSGHNPLHDVKHAVEEVFESFWHLDGRAFRTLRDLMVPGRVACNYLRGQRVRYIPPLRLFLVLTVLTFFVGRLTIGGDGEADPDATRVKTVNVGTGNTAFKNARTEAEVQAALDRTLAGIAKARTEPRKVPLMAGAMVTAETEARAAAAARVAELRAHPVATSSPATFSLSAAPSASTPTAPAAKTATSDKADAEEVGKSMDQFMRSIDGARLRDPKRTWNAQTNPVDVPWLPAFGDRWFNHRVENFASNVDRVNKDGTLIFELMLAAVPSALFLMLPIFALLLKLLYLGSGRSYLEHLVVALYSHAFLLATLFANFVLALLPIASAVSVPLMVALWAWAGVYLLLMQHRVYAQHWGVTVGKFLAVAFLYQFLIVGAAMYIVFAGLTSGQ